jgi:hypothetical protein
MKKLLYIAISLFALNATAQSVAINTDGSAADNSALLDLKSTNQGVLVPRMTQANRNAITSPATGLMIFQTDNTPGFYYNAGTPATPNWQPVGGSPTSSGPTLLVRASANSAITLPFATTTASNNPSPVIANCFGSVATNVGAAYNAATGVFTAPSAGLYLVSVQVITATPTTTIAIIPYLDVNNDFINNTSNTDTVLGPDFLGTTTAAGNLLTGTQNRGTLTTQVYLTAGQVFSIRFQQNSTVVQPANTTNGTTNFTVVKLL